MFTSPPLQYDTPPLLQCNIHNYTLSHIVFLYKYLLYLHSLPLILDSYMKAYGIIFFSDSSTTVTEPLRPLHT